MKALKKTHIDFQQDIAGNHPLIWLDSDGRILRVQGDGIDSNEKPRIGKSILNFLPEDVHDRFIETLDLSVLEKKTLELILPAPGFCPYDWCLYFICPLKRKRTSSRIIMMLIDISDLKNSMEELHRERGLLMEKNIALTEVLHRTEQDQKEFRADLARTIEQNVIPALKRLVKKNGRINRTQLRLLEITLSNLVPLNDDLPEIYFKLSPREIEICNLIRIGATTKEIAVAMYVTTSTIKKHREKIRKKLNLLNKKINLISYLRKG